MSKSYPRHFRQPDATRLLALFEGNGYDALGAAVILTAFQDLSDDAERESAAQFVYGEWFETLCDGIGLNLFQWRRLARTVSAQALLVEG